MKGPFSDLLSAGLVKDLPDYSGVIAEGYDAIEGRREDDIPFYRTILVTPGHVVDLGCGTGRITAVLLELGHRVTAIDNAPAMLDKLRERFADQQNLSIMEAGMEAFQIPEPADTIVISYNSFFNMHTPALREQCLAACHAALRPGGSLIIDVDLRTHPNLQSGFYSQVVPEKDGRMNVFVDFADLQPRSGERQTQYLCLTLSPDGTFTGTLTATTDFVPSPPDLKEALLKSGFEIDRFLGDYAGTRLKDVQDKTKLIAIARRL